MQRRKPRERLFERSDGYELFESISRLGTWQEADGVLAFRQIRSEEAMIERGAVQGGGEAVH